MKKQYTFFTDVSEFDSYDDLDGRFAIDVFEIDHFEGDDSEPDKSNE